jgi:hypothetical protein
MGLQDIGDAPIEALHHAVGSGRSGFCQPMLNAQLLAQHIELMVAAGLAPPAANSRSASLRNCQYQAVIAYFLAAMGPYSSTSNHNSQHPSTSKKGLSSAWQLNSGPCLFTPN